MKLTEIRLALFRDEAKKLALTILENDNLSTNIGFLSGRSGIAFFLCHLGVISKNEKLLERGVKIIEEIHEEISSGAHKSPTFCSGITGYFWTLEYLTQAKVISIDTDDLLEDTDKHLYKEMNNFFTKGNFDFLHGAGGIMVYFLRRIKGNSRNTATLKSYLHSALDRLVDISIGDKKTAKWNSVYSTNDNKPSTNIGLSHGMSSIIVILCKLIDESIAIEKSKALLRKAVNYIITNKQNTEQYGSHFPTYSLDDRKPTTSRLGWCYGDLGVLNGLLIANQHLKDLNVEHLIYEVKTHLQARRELEKEGINDACLCHGTAGIALFAYNLHLMEPSDENMEFLIFWINATLKIKTKGKGKYYYNHHVNGSTQRIIRHNFLEGTAGIGSLFTAIGYSIDESSDWLEVLLLC